MEKWRYGVVLDAGSSGTRAHVYRWLDPGTARRKASKKQLHSLPKLETKKKWTKKVHPGISTFGTKPELVGKDHLKKLFDHTRDIIPQDAVPDTPIFLLATAGMRLLPDLQRKNLLAEICSYAQSHTEFQITSCRSNFEVIPGETEGLFGWLATNYLLGGFDFPEDHEHGEGHHTYGFLDMGGASAQIAFSPNATESEKHADDLKLVRLRTINGAAFESRIFVTTWLGYGANEARRRYVEALLEESGSKDTAELEDPCLPIGLEITTQGDVLLPGSTVQGKTPTLIGNGKFEECLHRTYPLLDKDAPCEDEPCLLHGVHVPAIDFDVNHFVGVSEYWHTTHEVFEMGHKDKAYDFNTYQQRVKEFCSDEWSTIAEGIEKHQWGKKVDEKTAVQVCFKASWLINLLHEGIGIPRVGLEETPGTHNGTEEVLNSAKEKGYTESFQAVDRIDDTEVSWTLGKMILHASSQIPPLDASLPVGFGTNIRGGGLPLDFQYAGPKVTSVPSSVNQTHPDGPSTMPDDEEETWRDTLFLDQTPRRIPGILLFLLMLCFAIFLLCGRDRRQRLYRRIGLHTAPTLRRRKPGPSKLPSIFRSSSSGGAYERVLEDGDAADQFELADADGGDGESSDSSGQSLGLGIRGGLVGGVGSRTESRERLVGLEGRRSGRGSPTRGRLGKLLED